MFSLKKSLPIQVDIKTVDQFLTRGVEKIFPSVDFLRARLMSGKRQTMYLGIDPTAPSLHLGHAIILKKMRDFQNLGHQVILLIGDFTGMVGDPTDKSATRKRLTLSEVLENSRKYKEQASIFLKFSGSNKAIIKHNSSWLGEMSFTDMVELSSLVTVDQMLKRDMFEKRISEGKPIYIHEFLYPLMQGYDSVAMDVDGEIGGNDQTFNMLVGRDLLKSIKNKEKFVIASKLLVDSTGKKMGKTEGNMVTLDDSPEEMFGKIMSWSDGLIVPAFELVTDMPIPDIERIKSDLSSGANPKDSKVSLAHNIVSMIHGQDMADKAKDSFENTFTKGEMPADTETIDVQAGKILVDILVDAKVVPSKSEFRRLVDARAISIVGGDTIGDYRFAISKDVDVRVGKKRFLKIKVK